jgi:hypothetical protein
MAGSIDGIVRGVRIYQGNKSVWCEATPWFPPEVKPVHKGLYAVGGDNCSIMNEWNGEQWIRGDGSPSAWQDVSWRGWTGEYL